MRALSKKEKTAFFVIDAIGKTIKRLCTRRRNSDGSLSKAEVQSILLLELWGIGDFVFASYCLPSLRKCFNAATITVLCSPVAAELIAGCPYVDEVIAYRFPWTKFKNKYSLLRYGWKSLIALVLTMRKTKFDIALTGRPDPRNNFLLWLLGARSRVGFGGRGGGFFLTNELGKKAGNQHHLARWETVLRAAGCTDKAFKHEFWPSAVELREADRVIAAAGVSSDDIIVGIHYGASNPQRRWPIDRLAEVAEQISRHPHVTVLVFSDPTEPNAIFPCNSTVVLPKVNIRMLAALLSKVDVLLCNDSGPMHIAAAVGTPVVALFGKSDPAEFGPLGSEHTIIEARVDCRPCYGACRYQEPRCWPTITVPEVVKAVERQIVMARGQNPH